MEGIMSDMEVRAPGGGGESGDEALHAARCMP